MGGRVKWVSNPCVRKNDNVVYLSDAECSYPPKEGPSPPVGGVGSYPPVKKPELTARA